MLDSMLRIVGQGGFQLQSKDGQVIWPTTFNPYTGMVLENPFQLTSLFYLGYLKNKKESSDKNGTAEETFAG